MLEDYEGSKKQNELKVHGSIELVWCCEWESILNGIFTPMAK